MASLKLVLDTNVLISAALSGQGAPAQLVRLVLERHSLIFSQATFEELRSRLYRPKFDRYIRIDQRERLLHDFNACAHWVEIGEPAHYCRDREDDKFFETALAGQAHYLISGDKDILEVHPSPGLLCVSPAAGLDLLRR